MRLRRGIAQVLEWLRDAPLTRRQLADLRDSERWSTDLLHRLQAKKLAALLGHARADCAFYQQRLGNSSRGHPADDVTTLLRGVPVLSKEDVRRHVDGMVSRGLARSAIRYSTTGGTTGEPLTVGKSRSTVIMAAAALHRGMAWAGVRPNDRCALVKSLDRVSALGRLYSHLRGVLLVPAYSHAQSERVRTVGRLRRFRPRYVSGYPTSLLSLAEAEGPPLPAIPVVLSTGESLHGHQRELLGRKFGGRVFDYYGSNEISGLAFECEFGVKHVTDEHVVLETVDESGHNVWGETGRILVTDLDNCAMPLIRYELGDLGILSRTPCRCGRSLTVLQSLEGRSQDVLRNRAGTTLPAIFFAGRFRNLNSLTAYQLVQLDLNRVELRHVAGTADCAAEVAAIAAAVVERLGHDMEVLPVKCQNIPHTARGKRRLVVGLSDT